MIKITTGMLNRIRELNRAGKTDVEIARELDISYTTANRYRRKLGIDSPHYESLPAETVKDILLLEQEGKSTEETAEILGMSTSTVRRVKGMQSNRSVWAVYRKDTDELVCVGTVMECADFMGIKRESFRSMKSPSREGRYNYVFVRMEEDDDAT